MIAANETPTRHRSGRTGDARRPRRRLVKRTGTLTSPQSATRTMTWPILMSQTMIATIRPMTSEAGRGVTVPTVDETPGPQRTTNSKGQP